MSKREQDVLDFIRSYRNRYGLSPSIREIGEGIGLHSTSSIQKYIQSLTEQGYLQKIEGKTRALIPLEG